MTADVRKLWSKPALLLCIQVYVFIFQITNERDVTRRTTCVSLLARKEEGKRVIRLKVRICGCHFIEVP